MENKGFDQIQKEATDYEKLIAPIVNKYLFDNKATLNHVSLANSKSRYDLLFTSEDSPNTLVEVKKRKSSTYNAIIKDGFFILDFDKYKYLFDQAKLGNRTFIVCGIASEEGSPNPEGKGVWIFRADVPRDIVKGCVRKKSLYSSSTVKKDSDIVTLKLESGVRLV
jgi:hypothetical protein